MISNTVFFKRFLCVSNPYILYAMFLFTGNALLFLLPAEESYVEFISINQKVCGGFPTQML